MPRTRFQFGLNELLAFIGLLCLTIGTYLAARRLVAIEPQPFSPYYLIVMWLLFISIGAAGATVGILFRRPMECAVIAWALVLVPIAMLLLSAATSQSH